MLKGLQRILESEKSYLGHFLAICSVWAHSATNGRLASHNYTLTSSKFICSYHCANFNVWLSAQMETLIAYPLPPEQGYGFTWTLASRFSVILRETERLFGPRDANFTFVGYEFAEQPGLWFPENHRHVIAQLSKGSADSFTTALFEIAQTTVLLLSPVRRGAVSALQMGLSVHFGQDYLLRHVPSVPPWEIADCYLIARNAVRRLLSMEPDCIREIRRVEPCLTRITAADLMRRVPALDQATANFLASPFDRGLTIADVVRAGHSWANSAELGESPPFEDDGRGPTGEPTMWQDGSHGGLSPK